MSLSLVDTEKNIIDAIKRLIDKKLKRGKSKIDMIDELQKTSLIYKDGNEKIYSSIINIIKVLNFIDNSKSYDVLTLEYKAEYNIIKILYHNNKGNFDIIESRISDNIIQDEKEIKNIIKKDVMQYI